MQMAQVAPTGLSILMRYEGSGRNRAIGIEGCGGERRRETNDESIQNMLNLKKQKATEKTGIGNYLEKRLELGGIQIMESFTSK